MSAISVDEIMEHEERSMHRPCKRLHAHVFELDGATVTTVLYETRVVVDDERQMIERRAALAVNDRVNTSIIVDSRFEPTRP